MTQSERNLEQIVLVRVMRLNAVAQGVVAGLMVGLGLFLATLWLVLKGGDVVGPHLGLLGQYLIGYDVTLAGSFVGFLYGFLIGFVCGYLVSVLYNRIADARERGSAVA